MRIILSAIGLASVLTAGAVVKHSSLNANQPVYVTEISPGSWSSATSPENVNASSTPNPSQNSNAAPLPLQPTLLDQVAMNTNTGVVLLPVGTVVEVVEDYGPNVIVFWNGHRFWLHREALVRSQSLVQRSVYERITSSFRKSEKTSAAPSAPSVANKTTSTVASNPKPAEATLNKAPGIERSVVRPTAQTKAWVPSPTMLSPRTTKPVAGPSAPVSTGYVSHPAATNPIVRPAPAVVAVPTTRSVPVETRSRVMPVGEGVVVR